MGNILIGHLVDWRDDAIPGTDVFHLARIDHPRDVSWGSFQGLRVPVIMDPNDGTTNITITLTNCVFDGSQGNGKRIESGATVTLPRREGVAIVSSGGGAYV
jgi:hypothetical protein